MAYVPSPSSTMTASTATWGLGSSSCFVSSYVGTTITVDTIAAAFPSCNAMKSIYASCNAKPTGTALDDCICNQNLFNDIYGCRNEWRVCMESDSGDSNAQSVLSNWHQQCSGIATPTTPALTSLSTTLPPPQVCGQLQAACQTAVQAGNACVEQYPKLSQSALYSSCVCQQSVLSAASVCGYDGNKTCLGIPAALSNIAVWNYCPTEATSFLSQQSAMATRSNYTFSAPSIASVISTTGTMTASPTVTASSGPMSSSSPASTSSTNMSSPGSRWQKPRGGVVQLVQALVVSMLSIQLLV